MRQTVTGFLFPGCFLVIHSVENLIHQQKDNYTVIITTLRKWVVILMFMARKLAFCTY